MKTVLFLLGELDDDDIDWLIAIGRRQEIPAGTVLIQEGRPIDNLYILLEGILSVTTLATQGKEIANLLSGDIVGEMSFVDTRLPSATVSAKASALVLAIPRNQLAEKLRLDVGFAARFYRALAISLSTRLRLTVKQFKQPNHQGSNHQGPNDQESNNQEPNDQELSVHELTPDAKANVALAKTRLDWLLRRLKGSL